MAYTWVQVSQAKYHAGKGTSRAHLTVGGVESWGEWVVCKQGIKAPIDPSQTQMQQMIKAWFAPTHSGSLQLKRIKFNGLF